MNSIRLDHAADLPTPLLKLRRPTVSAEMLISVTSLYFVLVCNHAFWGTALNAGAGFGVCLGLGLAITALHSLLFGLSLWGPTIRPLLAVLLLVTSLVSWHMDQYGIVFDTDMIHNVLETDPAEVRELISSELLLHLLLTGLIPALLVLAVRVRVLTWRRTLRNRLLFVLAMFLVSAAAIVPVSRDVFALFRNERALRYQIAPGNYLIGVARATVTQSNASAGPKKPVAADARQVSAPPSRRSRVLILVVGETVRGDHWGLNGYERQTTPLLAARNDVVNFPDVTACGTSTAISLPCIFSPFGRENYDREAILSHESLIDVLARVGVGVLWRDNQAGCKSVCTGVEMETMAAPGEPELCRDGRCFDELLLRGLEARIDAASGDLMVVLHPIGNHGPNYFERYPSEYDHFQPSCHSAELSRCSREEIINAYDNAVLYADSVLNDLIELLYAQQDRDIAMLYVSDHGESLGEYGVYLHGAPYALAPKAQLHVPMVLWMSPSFVQTSGIDENCVLNSASQPHSHDDVFDSVLGLFDVTTSQYQLNKDILGPCRQSRELTQED